MSHPDRIQQCHEALRGPPMTAEEFAYQLSLRAAEMARADARRQQPSQQMELTP